MKSHCGSATSSQRRQHITLALIAALLVNLLVGSFSHQASASDALAGAIEICTADGSSRYLLPDGSTAPQPDRPAHDGQGCPDCTLCLHGCGVGCGTASGLAILATWIGGAAGDLRLLAAGLEFIPQRLFALRHPSQAPPPALA